MPGKALRTALVRVVVLTFPWVASRLAFSAYAPPKGWQMRQIVVFAGVSVADGRGTGR